MYSINGIPPHLAFYRFLNVVCMRSIMNSNGFKFGVEEKKNEAHINTVRRPATKIRESELRRVHVALEA